MRIVAVVNARRLSDGALEQFGFSDRGMTTTPASTPANTRFPALIESPVLGRVDMFDKLTTFGGVDAGRGDLRLINAGGVIDWLLTDYAVNGQQVLVYSGDDDALDFPGDYTLMHSARALAAVGGWDLVTIQLADDLAKLKKSLLPNTYTGGNALPAGTEGLPSDLKGSRKPRVYGRVQNISPYYVNTSRLIYQISDRPCSVMAAYSRGVGWVAEAPYAAFADLQNDALEPANSKYKVYSGPEGCFVRLGSVPSGTFTIDAETTETRCGELLKTICIDAGVAPGGINAADVAHVNIDTAPCGIWVTEDMTGLDAANQVASASAVYFRFNRLGQLRMGRIEQASSTPDYTIKPHYVVAMDVVALNDTENGAPAGSVTVEYGRNYTVQNDLADTAAQGRASFAAAEWRKAIDVDAGIRDIYVDAPDITVQSSTLSESKAQELASTLLSQLSGRLALEVTIKIDESQMFDAIDIGNTVRLQYPRFGLHAGRNFVIIGIVYHSAATEITLRLLGSE